MLVDIPDDLAETVASAIQSRADWFRRDTGHCAEGIASLRSDADRLDALADGIERRHADLAVLDQGSPQCDKCDGSNDRAAFANYCTSCSEAYSARHAGDPEYRPVGSR